MLDKKKIIKVRKQTYYTPSGLSKVFAVSVSNMGGCFVPARTFYSEEELNQYLKQEGVKNGYNS